MWTQSLDPFNSLLLSAVIAAIPILVFLLCLVAFKLTGLLAAGLALLAEILIALLAFRMPFESIAGASLLGFLNAIWPIAYIIVMAVWLFGCISWQSLAVDSMSSAPLWHLFPRINAFRYCSSVFPSEPSSRG